MKKKINRLLALLSAVLLLLAAAPFSVSAAGEIWDGSVADQIAKGSGTKSDPYVIRNGSELAYLAGMVNDGNWYVGKYFKLGANIQLNDPDVFQKDSSGKITGIKSGKRANQWTPIGKYNEFQREPMLFLADEFDGAGYTVSGIYINTETNFQGLFGAAFAAIKNLEVADSYINGGETVGAIAGRQKYALENCKSTNNTVIGKTNVGGLVADKWEGEVSGCTNSSAVTVLYTEYDPTPNERMVGGIVGTLTSSGGPVTACKNAGTITGNRLVAAGGIAGKLEGGVIELCHNFGSVGGYAQYAGGILGKGIGTVTRCYNAASTKIGTGNSDYAGGVAGYLWGGSTELSYSYNTGEVSAENAGGILGRNYSVTVRNCYTLYMPSSAKGKGYSPASGECTAKSVESNCYIVSYDGNITLPSGNFRKTPEDMKGIEIISLLANGVDGIWKQDTDKKNNGYPILEGFAYTEKAGTDPYPVDPPPPAAGFDDVKEGTWWYKPIHYVVDNGLFKGVSTTKFNPGGNMTREMFVTVLGRMAEKEGEETDGFECGFTDVKKGTEYAKYIAWASNCNIVNGYTSTKFGMGDKVTREQAAAFMMRYIRYMNISVDTSGEADLSQYADEKYMSAYAKEDIASVISAGIFNGYRTAGSDGKYVWTFKPKNAITRAEAAQILYNFME